MDVGYDVLGVMLGMSAMECSGFLLINLTLAIGCVQAGASDLDDQNRLCSQQQVWVE